MIAPNRGMRIAIVSPYDVDVPGGVQSHVLQLADHLRSGGDDVHVVAPGRRSRGVITAVGGSVRIPFNDSVAPVALSPLAARRVRAVLHELAPDVVHVHEPMVPMVSLAAATADICPTVATFHAWSHDDRLYRGVRAVTRRVVAGLDVMVAVSSAAADYHAGALGIRTGRFRVIPNGIDHGRFAHGVPYGSMLGTPSLLFVGRLEPRKGLADLVTAFVRVKEDHPTVRLYVVGEGPERDAAQQGLPMRLRSDVVFLGRVDDAELPRLYRSADVYVSPALGGESFGIVLAEAMAAGTTVVASDLPGYRSVVDDGVTGMLVPPGDPATLAQHLSALLANPGRRTSLATLAQQESARFDWSVVAAQVRAAYLDAVAGR